MWLQKLPTAARDGLLSLDLRNGRGRQSRLSPYRKPRDTAPFAMAAIRNRGPKPFAHCLLAYPPASTTWLSRSSSGVGPPILACLQSFFSKSTKFGAEDLRLEGFMGKIELSSTHIFL